MTDPRRILPPVWRRKRVPTAGTLLILLLVMTGCGASGPALTHLTNTRLRRFDVPQQYIASYIHRRYFRYIAVMTVGTARCVTPRTLKPDSWWKGVIVSLQSQQDNGFMECSYVLHDNSAAQSAISDERTAITTGLSLDPAPDPHIGDESVAASTTGNGLTGHAVAFRRANIVIRLTYFAGGPQTLSLNEVEHLARIINSRLQ